MENWTRRKARSRGEQSSMNLAIVEEEEEEESSRCLFPRKCGSEGESEWKREVEIFEKQF